MAIGRSKHGFLFRYSLLAIVFIRYSLFAIRYSRKARRLLGSNPNLPEMRMPLLRALAILVLTLSSAVAAVAQGYPTKPVKIIVSTSAGGITDLAARILGAHITAKSGQPVVIDNRPGASGNIAMDAVAKAPPDGCHVGVANTGNIVINPYLMRHSAYDPLNDLVPVGTSERCRCSW